MLNNLMVGSGEPRKPKRRVLSLAKKYAKEMKKNDALLKKMAKDGDLDMFIQCFSDELRGGNWWSDMKKGMNMVFQPAAKVAQAVAPVLPGPLKAVPLIYSGLDAITRGNGETGGSETGGIVVNRYKNVKLEGGKVKKTRKLSKGQMDWVCYVRTVAKDNNISYKEALKVASKNRQNK